VLKRRRHRSACGNCCADQGGDTICLPHKEVDAYLTAEGIFTGIGIPEEVHLRARNPKKEGKALAASRAPITFWHVRSSSGTRSMAVRPL